MNQLQDVLSLTISFFVRFHVDSLDEKVRSDKVIRLNHVHISRIIFRLSNMYALNQSFL